MSGPYALFDQDRTGKTGLHYCCTSDSKRAAQVADLLTMAAPDLVETRDEDGFTPLHLAVIAGNTQLVTFLLANGADVSAVDNEKHTVVHWATVCGETTALRSVLAAGAPVSTPDVHGGYPLHYAVQMCGGDKDADLGLQVLHSLLGHKDVDVSVEDGDKRQPLLWAASAGSAKAIVALVRAGAIVESSDRDGLTGLHCAASRGHTDCMDTLLTLCGASPDVIDSNGCTALHYAVTLGHADATALLLAHGADPNRQDRKGRSPAHCGCAKGQFETVKLIGGRGANLWMRNARGDLPLHEAAASGRRELVSWLLAMRPSQVNSRNNDGRTPLHMAALNDNVDMCKILLDSGASVNPILRTSKNVFMTPLDCALQRGFRSTAKYLQMHGGVPASRLGAPVPDTQMNNSLSLQIRDDVTFWGDSSSESEEAKLRVGGRSAKKVQKRKMSMRNRKKKILVPGSSGRSKEKSVSEVVGGGSPRNVSSSRIDYSNEIIINGRTEINIHHTKEITLDAEGESSPRKVEIGSNEKITVPSSGKRPKSAKFTKLGKEKSGSDKETTTEPHGTTHSTGTSDDTTMETVIDTYVQKTELKQSSHDLPDISNTTSEEVEGPHEVLVEASVHAEPKKTEGEEEGQIKGILKTSLGTDTAKFLAKEQQQSVEKAEASRSAIIKEEIKVEATEMAMIVKEERLVEIASKATETVVEDVKEADVVEESNEEAVADGEDKVEAVISELVDEVVVEKETKVQEIKELAADFKETKELSKELEESSKGKAKKFTQKPKRKTRSKKTDQPAIMKVFKPGEKVSDSQREKSEEDTETSVSEMVSDSIDQARKTHKSFKVLSEKQAKDLEKEQKKRLEKPRSKSDDTKFKDQKRTKKCKIPAPTFQTPLSKSDRQLDRLLEKEKKRLPDIETRIPSLPNIHETTKDRFFREDSNLSAPVLPSMYTDNERGSASDFEDDTRLSSTKKKKVKKRPKTRRRESRSAGSDYESSNLIDSGFEPSPRSSRIPKWKNMSDRGVNMTSVTRSIQTNIRRYHLERKIFQHLLELKRSQIRAGQHNEAILVKRAIDHYNQSCSSTVGAGRYIAEDFTFKSFEKFLYDSLRKLQKIDVAYLKGLPDASEHLNPLLCTQSTHRCMHATHAYTGIPCAAYLPKMDHHTIPKIGFEGSAQCKPATAGFLPRINPKKAVTLELSHGTDKQVISLPTDKLDQNKRYYVTFTVKGQEGGSSEDNGVAGSGNNGHIHSKSD
ncbi:inversin isoform X2 [Euwallacea fornicatus]|uniref:inversin isoform X2 n=1 Tax=Euwallacea fornicatus TaxID=995702 RepID=UPI00338D49BB